MSPTKSTVNYTQMCYICSTKYDKNQSCYWPSICVLIEHMLRLFPASPALRKGDLRICGLGVVGIVFHPISSVEIGLSSVSEGLSA